MKKRLLAYSISLVILLVAGFGGVWLQSSQPALKVQDRITAVMYDCPYPYDVERDVWYMACANGWDLNDPYLIMALDLEKNFPFLDVIFFGSVTGNGVTDVALIVDVGITDEADFLAAINYIGDEIFARLALDPTKINWEVLILTYWDEDTNAYVVGYFCRRPVGGLMWEVTSGFGAVLYPQFEKLAGNPYAE